MISLTLKGVIDLLMVGRLGTEALAAVGLAGILAWIMMSFPLGMLRGQRPLVSQYLGAGDRKAAFSFGAHSFYLALGFGVITWAIAAPAANFIIEHAAADLTEQARSYARDYLTVRLQWSAPAFLALAIAEYMRSTSRPRVAMAADLIAHPLNMALSWALIFGHLGLPQMGVRGAALGTGLADLVALCLLLWLTQPKKPIDRDLLRFQWTRMRGVLSTGLTGGVQFTIEGGSFALITVMIGTLGTIPLAVHNTCINLIHLSFMPAVAVGDAGSVLIGRFVGEKRYDLVERSLRSTLAIILPFMGFMGLMYFLFGEQLVGVYIKADDPNFAQVVALGGKVMVAAAIWQLGDALQVAYRFGLRAAGDHRWVMWTGILVAWVLSVPLAWLVIHLFDGDLVHVWLVWTAEIFIGGGIFWRRWRSGKWRSKRLVQDESPAGLGA